MVRGAGGGGGRGGAVGGEAKEVGSEGGEMVVEWSGRRVRESVLRGWGDEGEGVGVGVGVVLVSDFRVDEGGERSGGDAEEAGQAGDGFQVMGCWL